MADVQPYVDAVDDWIVERPGAVVLAFLLVTAGFGVGLGAVTTETGTEQFTEATPAQAALEDVERDFEPAFGTDEGTTQLIQSGQNVLSKPGLRRMLEVQAAMADRPGMRVSDARSGAATVATVIDPTAETPAAQLDVIETATPSRIDAAVRTAADRPGFRAQVSEDFNRRAATASATVGVVEHRLPAGLDAAAAGASGESPLTSIQLEAQRIAATEAGDVEVFGAGVLSAEFGRIIVDSLLIVVPAAVAFILLFLVVAYRDPVDLFLGLVALAMTIVWTLGFTGLVGIPFSQILIAVPPLLLAVGIDFGIHAINRYREERVEGFGVAASMRAATDQLLVAFFIVTTTTVLGFLANVTSALGPIREFGVVAAVGIVFTFLVFGVFLPAAKVLADRLREGTGFPTFGSRPLGSEGSALGRALGVGVFLARRAPVAVLVVVVVVTGAAGAYGTGVDTSFSQEQFLPPEETPAFQASLPEPFRPGEYRVTRLTNFLENRFESAEDEQVTVYLRAPMRRDGALEAIQRAGLNPPDSVVTEDRRARAQSVLDVIDAYAAQSPEFAALVARNDLDGDGVPDDDLDRIYARLFASPVGDQARQYLTPDRRSARIVYATKGDVDQATVTADARALADRYRYDATATGQIVVFQAIADTILTSALRSLGAALAATAAFLLLVYRLIEGRATLGLVNLAPIVVTLALLAGSMRALSIPFNALTATILSITIGLGIDYSAHVVHRFAAEYEPAPTGGRPAPGGAPATDGGDPDPGTADVFEALSEAVVGTGGALAGSMLTTVSGVGVLVLAITPVLGQFGVLTALSVLYSFLTAVLVTPPVVVVWSRLLG